MENYYFNELKDALFNLIDSAHSYDKGNFAQAKNMSSIIRLILRDIENPRPNNRTVSILKHLQRKDSMKFYNTGYEASDPLLSISLVGMVDVPISSPDSKQLKQHIYLPVLDKSNFIDVKWLTFDQWWNSVIVVDKSDDSDIIIKRKWLILAMAQQGGGAHLDAVDNVEELYLSLATAKKSILKTIDNGVEVPIQFIHYALVRQITHELIITLKKEFNIIKYYYPSNAINLKGIPENNIKQPGFVAEVTKSHSTRTDFPYRLPHVQTLTPPPEAAYMKIFY